MTLITRPGTATCPVAWCDRDHDDPKSGEEIRWHSRMFADKTFPGGRQIVITAGWGEPMTRWRLTGCAAKPNVTEPPYIRIVHVDDTGPSTVEVGVFEAMVLADCMKLSGDTWLASTLAAVADMVNDGTPEVRR